MILADEGYARLPCFGADGTCRKGSGPTAKHCNIPFALTDVTGLNDLTVAIVLQILKWLEVINADYERRVHNWTLDPRLKKRPK